MKPKHHGLALMAVNAVLYFGPFIETEPGMEAFRATIHGALFLVGLGLALWKGRSE